MRFASLTLNPCLDKTMYFDSFSLGGLNRAVGSNVTLGSKGINVARVFNILGQECCAFAFSGGSNGSAMRRIVEGEGLRHLFVETAAETRMNVKIIDTSTGVCTEANERGGPMTASEYALLENAIVGCFGEVEYFCLGGSIPQGVDKSVYNRLIRLGNSAGVKMILDCDGEALVEAAALSPYLIKPNLFELGHLCGRVIAPRYDGDGTPAEDFVAEVGDICREMAVKFSTRILCTMSGDGAFYSDGADTVYTPAPRVVLRGFTGAGDTFLTAFMFVFAGCDGRAGDYRPAIRFAASAAAAKVELEGTTLPCREAMYRYV